MAPMMLLARTIIPQIGPGLLVDKHQEKTNNSDNTDAHHHLAPRETHICCHTVQQTCLVDTVIGMLILNGIILNLNFHIKLLLNSNVLDKYGKLITVLPCIGNFQITHFG